MSAASVESVGGTPSPASRALFPSSSVFPSAGESGSHRCLANHRTPGNDKRRDAPQENHLHALGRLALCWGIVPHQLEAESDMERLTRRVRERVAELGFANRGERFVMVLGAPGSPGGTTNAIHVEDV